MHNSATNAHLLARFHTTRRLTLQLVEPLSEEDCQIQSMPDTSPAKWHLAHSTWFFETFVLRKRLTDFRVFDTHYQQLFNSYYNAIGTQFDRPQRGVLSRPSLREILHYRRHVDEAMHTLLQASALAAETAFTIELGIHHEQQHQELLLMDIKHAFACNPMYPAYREGNASGVQKPPDTVHWSAFEAGLATIGHNGREFCFDNERPQHRVYVDKFRLANRPVSNAEYLDFIDDGGYRNPLLWHADGWTHIQSQHIRQPLYWRQMDGGWFEYTLHGLRPLNPAAPVCHVNFFEASAFAQWRGKRLPTEAEWETAARHDASTPQYLSLDALQPRPAAGTELQGMHGGCWEWTASSYSPYPGFRPFAGEAGEYNGKFMVGQYVLRGGCCLSPPDHIRSTYRNFFYPHQSWQPSGIRLAEDSP